MDDKKNPQVIPESNQKNIPLLYTEEETTLINLVFEKILKIIVTLSDADQPIEKIMHRGVLIKAINWSKIPSIFDKDYSGITSVFDKDDKEKEFSRPRDIRIFYGPDGLIPNDIQPIDYLHRIQRTFYCSASCYVVALIYIERFINKIDVLINKKGGSNIFNQFACFRIFLAAITVATKCLDDKYYKNTYYAKAGGVDKKELWEIEHQFLMIMKSDLDVSLEAYNAAATEPLDAFIARKQMELAIKLHIEEPKRTIQTRGTRKSFAKLSKKFLAKNN